MSLEWANGFACGTLVDRRGQYHHTTNCRYFSEIRKPLDSRIADLETKLANREHRIARLEAYALNLESAGARLDVSIGCGCVHSGEGTCAACKDAQREWDAAKGAKP